MGKARIGAEAFEQASHAVITGSGSSAIGHQVLVNPLGGKPLRVPGENELSPRLGIALPPGRGGLPTAVRVVRQPAVPPRIPGRRNGCFESAVVTRAGSIGALAAFEIPAGSGCAANAARRMCLRDRAAINLQRVRDAVLGPMLRMKREYRLDDGHFESIRHHGPPSAALPLEGP